MPAYDTRFPPAGISAVRARKIVIAVGGNALAPAGEPGTFAEQLRHVRDSLDAIVEIAREEWLLALVHGNGPQVGNLLVQQELAREAVPPLPLYALDAATQGWIGLLLQQALQNALGAAGVARPVVSLVTQVVVDRDDPAFARPSKPIGQTLGQTEARALAAERGWHVAPVHGGWRRVVASPEPREIVERETIRALVRAGTIVIAAGGGGVPVWRDEQGALEGVDAVIDKDRAAAVLARDIGAETLLILTDVAGVYTGYDTPAETLLRRLDVSDAERLLASGALGAGSMAPKVEAALRFLASGGRRAVIARLDQAREALAGRAGTEVGILNDEG